MSFSAAFGSTDTAPTDTGFAGAFGQGNAAPTVNVPQQRQAAYTLSPQPPSLLSKVTNFLKTGSTAAPGTQPLNPIQSTGAFFNAFSPAATSVGQGMVRGVKDLLTAPPTPTAPITLASLFNGIYGQMTPQGPEGGIVGDTFQSWVKAANQVQSAEQQPTFGGRALGLANAGVGAIQAFFQPVSTVFQEAATIPGPVGQLADLVNKGFSGLGKVGSNSFSNILQATPLLTPEQKTALTPLAQNLGALTSQIIVGGATADTFGALKDNTNAFLSKLSEDARIKALDTNPDIQAAILKQTTPTKTLPVTSETPTETPVPITTGEESAPSEPYTPDSELPTIQMGKSASDLPTIQTEPTPSDNIPTGTKLVPEPSQTAPTSGVIPKTDNVPSMATEAPQTAVSTPESAPVKVQQTGAITSSASDINDTLVKQGFDALTPDEKSHYTPESYKEISDNLTKGDPTEITKMATGEIPVDKSLYGQGQILYKTVSQLAANTNNGDLMAQLARSPLGKKLSLLGQGLGEAGYVKSDGSIDSVGVLRQLSNTWDATLKEKGTSLEKEATKTETSMKQIAKSVRSPKSAWSKLVAEVIACR